MGLSDFEMFWLYITVQLDPLYTGDEIINTAKVTGWSRVFGESSNESTLFLPVTHTVIPAPGAVLLGGIGVCVVGWLGRRKAL